MAEKVFDPDRIAAMMDDSNHEWAVFDLGPWEDATATSMSETLNARGAEGWELVHMGRSAGSLQAVMRRRPSGFQPGIRT